MSARRGALARSMWMYCATTIRSRCAWHLFAYRVVTVGDNLAIAPGAHLHAGQQASGAAASGVGTAAFGALGGKVAGSKLGQRLGLSDVDTMLAAGKFSKTPGGFIKQVVGSGISEGVLEELPQSVQEQMWQNYATDKPLTEGVGNAAALGLLSGAAMGGAGGGFNVASASLLGDEKVAPGPGAAPAPAPVQAPAPAPTPAPGPAAPTPSVATSDTTQAEAALLEPKSLTALDRASAIDAEAAGLQQQLDALMLDADLEQEPARQNMATQISDLEQERAAIAATWPQATKGAATTFSTEAGVRLTGEYALMEADDLITSHTEGLKPNPLYPAELQPRDRSRSASELQVSGIVQKLDPARLGMSADSATGAPIVGADGLVKSGNARTIALKRIYQHTNGAGADTEGGKAFEYRQFLSDNAAQFGLAPEALASMNKPVLVRIRSTPVNRAEFARQANASTVQRMSPSEQALTDARRLQSLDALEPTEDGDFSSSRDFIRQFMAALPITEQSDLIESDGRLSTAGYRRIQNAVLAHAYGDSPSLRRMTESMDNNLANVSKALVRVAPTIAAARERMRAGTLHDADIAPDLLSAVERLSALKEKGWTVAQELAQTDIEGPRYSPEASELLGFLSDNIRSPRRIAEFFQRYYEALEQAGHPTQPSMFGDDGPAPARADLLTKARAEPGRPSPARAPIFDFDTAEQALREERDRTSSEIEAGWMQSGNRRRLIPLERAVYDAVTTSTLTAENARKIVDVALSQGRNDLAEYAVRRAERMAQSIGTTPGVPESSPKNEAIKKDFERNKAEETKQAQALRQELKLKQGAQPDGNTAENPERRIAGESAPPGVQAGGEPQDAPGHQGGDQGDGPARADAAGGQPGAAKSQAVEATPAPAKPQSPAPQAPAGKPTEKTVRTYTTRGKEVGAEVREHTDANGKVAYSYSGKWGAGSGIDADTMAAKEAAWREKKSGFTVQEGVPDLEAKKPAPETAAKAEAAEKTPFEALTQTAAFKKWFAGSAVVDADGRPLSMYYGTSASQGGDAFTLFDTFASNYGLMGMGGYFTADPQVASSYTAKSKGATPTVYKVYLSIQRPLDMDAPADAALWQKQFPDAEQYLEGGATNEDWYRAAEEALADRQMPKWEGAEIMQDGLRAWGSMASRI